MASGMVDDRLALIVRDGAGHAHRGAVLCAEVEGNSALLISGFHRHRAPPIAIGTEVQLSMPGLHPPSDSTFPARALQRSEDRMQVRYHFEVGPAIGWVLAKITDRRFAARVRPYPLAPVGAVLERRPGGLRIPVTVKDISATGIGVLVPLEHEPRLFSEWKLRLWLQIPVDTGPPMELVGRVCSRRLEGERILYGIDFDSVATEGFGAKQDVIYDYVASCQAAAIYMFRHGTVDLQLVEAEPAAAPGLPGAALSVADPSLSAEFRAARDLDRLAAAWPGLSEPVRQAILVLVDAGSGHARGHVTAVPGAETAALEGR